ncbi:hypothetical protein [Wolbachia endosymbiont of Dirofilaria (Dirofilaria) immitis]|uniref:hypothetical protein n=1 Tax=Wolbachia endosymbiont of Dirofilaria (Dirofilaria) immitis TaxID=1812115 RepID=UPI00158DF430|nr:hypothetical protein [Wolbachia endosymbiont of Dirofilaria (Dirofilaria) immitis]QKX02208.1 hypothetical protein GOY12_01325 [Wolbachia endosymbiont of Dirofilaria (Dirofilaria) immitis]
MLLVPLKSSIGKIGKSGSLYEKELKALTNLAEDFNATYIALLPVKVFFTQRGSDR